MEQFFDNSKETGFLSSSLPNRLEMSSRNQGRITSNSQISHEYLSSSPDNPTNESFSTNANIESKPRRKSESYAHSPSNNSLSSNDFQYLPYVHHTPQLNYGNEQLSIPWQNYQELQSSPYFQLHTTTLDKKVVLYKTEMCRTFEETGICKYGIKCQFAHDPAEIRLIPRHPRYKTEICKTFWHLGNCPYGKRCCFIHTENELRDKSGKQKNDSSISLSKQSDVFNSIDTILLDEIITEPIHSRNSSRSSSPTIDESSGSVRIHQRRKSIIEGRIINQISKVTAELSANDPEIQVMKGDQVLDMIWSSVDTAPTNSEKGLVADNTTPTTSNYVLFSKSPGSRAFPISKSDIWACTSVNSSFLSIPSQLNCEAEPAVQDAAKSGSSSRSSSSRQHLLMEMITLLDSQ